ncbi:MULTISPECIES: hypothetical protein [Erwinia]|jgi:hypothetical protein|uniref:Fimbrial protein n=2 Tax=Erwinia TaxID=551 RepID=A0ABW7CLM9_9GAMM|nr:hypothetical protein [Erwinia sp. BC051422]MDN8542233.1 hypothetical protein [Erwinia sp. BC051422]
MKRIMFALSLICFSTSALAWYYNSVPGVTTGLTVRNNMITVEAGTDVWLCSSRGNDRDLVFHIYGLTVRDPEVAATFIGMSDAPGGAPTVQQCQNATDEPASRIKVAQYRLTQTVSVPVQEGDYSACWSGWDGLGKDARCSGGIPITPIDDCHAELVSYPNDLGTVIVGEPINRNHKVGDLTLICKTVPSTTVEITQQASAGNVLEQQILDESGKKLEGLKVFTSGVTEALYMQTTGTPKVAQRIEDSVVVVLNYY